MAIEPPHATLLEEGRRKSTESQKLTAAFACFGVLGDCRRTTRQGNPSYSRGRGAAGAIFPAWRFTIDLDRDFLSVSAVMRLLGEIVIVAGLIYLGWHRLFKDWAAQGGAMLTSKFMRRRGRTIRPRQPHP